jgi:hypothetical protein
MKAGKKITVAGSNEQTAFSVAVARSAEPRVRPVYNPLVDGDAPPIDPLWVVSDFGLMTQLERRLEVLHHG